MRTDLAHALAGGFLAGEWDIDGLRASGRIVVGRNARWLPALTRQLLEYYPRPPLDRPRELAGVILQLPAASLTGRSRPVVHPAVPTRMLRNPWRLPELHDVAGLLEFLHLTDAELEWFSDPRHRSRADESPVLGHYLVTTRRSATGGVRVLEAPKPRLKALQRCVLSGIVGPIPVHFTAHGFVPGRSVATFAAPHAGRAVVLRMDLEGFFASVGAGRIYGVFRTAGFPEAVAYALTGLVTTVLPRRTWQDVPRPAADDLLPAHWRLGRRLAAPHLPQGAPTSPALANLAAYRLDIRLSALAESWGGTYTRYADDLAFSARNSWSRGTSRIIDLVTDVVRDEGFRINGRKTAVLPRGGRQTLGGLVVNERPHVPRPDVDRLRAILHNCRRDGPAIHNREEHPDFRAHLTGRVAYVAQHDPVRGARLRADLDAVVWDA